MSRDHHDKAKHVRHLLTDARLTRRGAIVAMGGAVLAAACEGSGLTPTPPTSDTTHKETPMANNDKQTSSRMPAVFLPHGGGPWPWIDESIFGTPGMWEKMSAYMKGLNMVPPSRPRAVLVVSAHWEEPTPTVMTAAKPPMLYDYYGFPKEAYEVEWPAPGEPELADEVRELLESAGIESAANAVRGFDHGTFVPLKLAYPDAEIPTTQLSLKKGLDPLEHIKMGRAIASLRDKDVFIVGSGMSYHNMRDFMMHMRRGGGTTIAEDSKAFDEWLAETIDAAPSDRQQRLVEWDRAPRARAAHPREEHLIPLHVVAGAAAEGDASLPYRDVVMGAHVSAIHFS